MKMSKPKRPPWQRFSEFVKQQVQNKCHEYYQHLKQPTKLDFTSFLQKLLTSYF